MTALRGDQPYLKSIGSFEHELDLNTFVNTAPLEQAYTATGQNYAESLASNQNASQIRGRDPVCNTDVDPADAAELWLDGSDNYFHDKPQEK